MTRLTLAPCKNQFRAWGPTDARFDHQFPPPSLHAREILFGAIGPQAGLTAVAEVFQDTRDVERSRKGARLVAFDTIVELQLLDLMGTWPTRPCWSRSRTLAMI